MITMRGIQQVFHQSTRLNFEREYRNAIGNEMAMKQLTEKVRNVLAQQAEKTEKIQLEIDKLNSDDERKNYIMNLADEGTRYYMIQANYDLFNNIPAVQQVVNSNEVVYDQVSGLYMDQKQLDEEKRKRIMSIPDIKERQKMIAMNVHLF